MAQPTNIYLVRHGVTQANKDNVFAGRTMEPLHAEGENQLREIGQSLSGKEIQKIFCGPLPRTQQSARIVADICDAEVVSCGGLNEIFIPHWDGLTKDAIRERFGDQYPSWLADPAGFAVDGCETIGEVQQRAVAEVENIFEQEAGRNSLIVSHLIVIRSLILHYTGQPIANFRSVKVANAQLVRLERDIGGKTEMKF